MQRVQVDLAEPDLEVVSEAADKANRSRKAQLEWIVQDWADRRREKK